MRRHIILMSLLAVMLVPDLASAFGFRRCGFGFGRGGGLGLFNRGRFMTYSPAYCPPQIIYGPPVYYYPPSLPACPPYGYLEVIPASPIMPSVSEPEKPKAAANPSVETIPSKPVTPVAPAVPKQPDVKPADLQRPELPAPANPKLPMPGIPEKKAVESSSGVAIPQVEPMPLPGRPPVGPLPNIPPTNINEPKKPDESGLKIPTLTPSNPGSSNIPPLSIPGVGESERIAKSSPISSPPPVNIYWVEGDVPQSPLAWRKVNFFNQTDADVQLTIEGRSVKLPRKHFVEVDVPAKFRWTYADFAEQITEIPLANPGAEIVLRRPKL